MNPTAPTKTASKKQQLSEKLARAEAKLAEEAARYKSDDARKSGQKKIVTWKPNGLVMAMHFLMDTKPSELWEAQPEEVAAHDQGVDDGKLKATVQWRHPIDLAVPEDKRVYDSEIPGKLFVRGKNSVEKGVQVQREKGIFGTVYLAGQIPPPNPSDPPSESPDDLSQMQDMPYHLLTDGVKEDAKVPELKSSGSSRRSQEVEIKENGSKLPPPPPPLLNIESQVKLQQQQQKQLKEQELLLLQTRQKRLQMEQLLVQQELEQHLAASRASLQQPSEVKSSLQHTISASRSVLPSEIVLVPSSHQRADVSSLTTLSPSPASVQVNSPASGASSSSAALVLPKIRPQDEIFNAASSSSSFSSSNCQRLSSSDLTSNLSKVSSSESISRAQQQPPAFSSLSKSNSSQTLVSDNNHKPSSVDPWSQLETLPSLPSRSTRTTSSSSIPPPPLPPIAQSSISRSSVVTLPQRPLTPPRHHDLNDPYFQSRPSSPLQRPFTPPRPPLRPSSPKPLEIKPGSRPSQMRSLVPQLASEVTTHPSSSTSFFNHFNSFSQPPSSSLDALQPSNHISIPVPPHIPSFPPPHPPPIPPPSIPPPPPRPDGRSDDSLAALLSDPSLLENMVQSLAEVTQPHSTTSTTRQLTASEKLQALISNPAPSKPMGPPPLPPALYPTIRPPQMVDGRRAEERPSDDGVRRFGFGPQFTRTEPTFDGPLSDDRLHFDRFDERHRNERSAPWPPSDKRYDRPHEFSRDQPSFDDRDRRRSDERSTRLIRVERVDRSERSDGRDYNKRTREGEPHVQPTKRCKNFVAGTCRFGAKCLYAHSEDESGRTSRRNHGIERP